MTMARNKNTLMMINNESSVPSTRSLNSSRVSISNWGNASASGARASSASAIVTPSASFAEITLSSWMSKFTSQPERSMM